MADTQMICVQKANVQLHVKAVDKDFYLAHGYSVVDKGKVIEEGIIHDIPTLQAKVKELEAENAHLKQVLEAYNSDDTATAKKPTRKTTKSE